MSWQARELGIDLAELETERFSHPRQVGVHLELYKRSDAYWGIPVVISDTPADVNDLRTTRL